jgi:hypothetical protein
MMYGLVNTPNFRAFDDDRHDSDSGAQGWTVRWILALLALGVIIRLARYLLRFPLWGDEALLAANLLDRDFAGLLRPLDSLQVAPYSFLVIEHTATLILGYSEWSLRLFPLLCSLGSLFLFHRLARLVFRREAVVLAVGIFAVSYAGLRYSSEVKPYGVDLFVSTTLLTLTASWWRRPDQLRWLWGLATIAPLALALSFPAIFVAGGTSLTIAFVLGTNRSRRGWLPWSVYNMIIVATFAGLYLFTIRAQEHASLGKMQDCWDHAFPPLSSPAQLLYWLLYAHTGPIFGQPVGGDHFGSIGTTLLCLVAAIVLWRARHYWFMLFCAAPFALNLAAAALRRFPYGGHMRMAMHLMPLVCLLAGFGAAELLRRLASRRAGVTERSLNNRRNWTLSLRPASVAAIALVLLGTASLARDCWLPCKDIQNLWLRDFSRWFWPSVGRDCELVCVEADLGEKFPSSPFYRCYQRIYSPRHARGEPAHPERASAARPLACVQYWSHFEPYDPAAFGRWLEKMKHSYDLVACQQYPVRTDADGDAVPEPSDRIEVYQFVPKLR